MTIDRKKTKISAVSDFMMFCQKEEMDHVLGNHKGARDHLVSTEWTTGKYVNLSSFSE